MYKKAIHFFIKIKLATLQSRKCPSDTLVFDPRSNEPTGRASMAAWLIARGNNEMRNSGSKRAEPKPCPVALS
jgi:hypothetical protein